MQPERLPRRCGIVPISISILGASVLITLIDVAKEAVQSLLFLGSRVLDRTSEGGFDPFDIGCMKHNVFKAQKS